MRHFVKIPNHMFACIYTQMHITVALEFMQAWPILYAICFVRCSLCNMGGGSQNYLGMHASSHTCTCTNTETDTGTSTQWKTLVHTSTHKHAEAHVHSQACIVHIHALTHAYTHTHTHRHVCMHAQPKNINL